MSLLKTEVKPVLDPFQFAYREGCGTENSVNTFTNAIAKHLESPKAYVRLLFVDFSLGFNTIKPHGLIKKIEAVGCEPFFNCILLLFFYKFNAAG